MMCWRAASSSQRRHASAMQDKADSPGGKLKVVLLGEAAVGKTTLWRRWLGTPLAPEYTPSTGGEQAGSIGCVISCIDDGLPCVRSQRGCQAASIRGTRASGL
jgi:hypothetical protein